VGLYQKPMKRLRSYQTSLEELDKKRLMLSVCDTRMAFTDPFHATEDYAR